MRRPRVLRVEMLEPRYALNAAPILYGTASPALAPVLENSVAPSGPVGTLVADLVDTDGKLNNFYDSDGDSPGIVIIDTNLQGGTLWYSLNGGGAWSIIGSPTDSAGRTLYADQLTRLYYQPPEGFTGEVTNVFVFRAWDRTGGYSNGSSDADVSVSVDVAISPSTSEHSVEMGSLELSADGSAVVIGKFTGTASFGSQSLTASAESDWYVAKIAKDGSVGWASQFGGPAVTAVVSKAVGRDGWTGFAGQFTGSASFGGITLSSPIDPSSFITVLDPTGNFLWAVMIQGSATLADISVHESGDGSVVVTGSFQGTISCGSRILQSSGGSDIFIAQFDSLGSCTWLVKGGGLENDAASSIACFADGSSVVTGHFRASAAFGSNATTSAGGADLFVAKLSSQGLFEWVTTAGGAGDDQGVSAAVRADGGLVVLSKLGHSPAAFAQTTIYGQVAAAELDEYGEFLWVTSASGRVGVDAIEMFADGSTVVSGSYVSAVFGGIALDYVHPPTYPASSRFVAGIDNHGEWIWARDLGPGDLLDWERKTVRVDVKASPDGAMNVAWLEPGWRNYDWRRRSAVQLETYPAEPDVAVDLTIAPRLPLGTYSKHFLKISSNGVENQYFSNSLDWASIGVLEVVSGEGAGVLAKDASGKAYAGSTPIFFGTEHAHSSAGGFTLTSIDSNANTIFAERNGTTYRVLANSAWRAPDLFNGLQNSTSRTLDSAARRRIQVSIAASGYRIYGDVNPTVVVQRGKTYTLDLDIAGQPFFLQTVAGAFFQQFVFTNGFDGSGRISGSWLWRVPENAPEELFYVSRDDARFGGRIILSDR